LLAGHDPAGNEIDTNERMAALTLTDSVCRLLYRNNRSALLTRPLMETSEYIPPKLEIPERLKKYLPQKMGFQLNGYETVLQAYQPEPGNHCADCCPDQRAEYFITENCDLWLVTTTGDIFVLPFGDDTFQWKFTARNYISWRPYQRFYSESCFGVGKDSFLKPFWKDYIGFQVDEFECVIFWRRTLIYHGAFDGRGIPYSYNYHERFCESATKSTYSYQPFALDADGKIQWENIGTESSPRWVPKRSDQPHSYYVTRKDCHYCVGDVDLCKCGYVPGASNPDSNLSRWKTWSCSPVDGYNAGKTNTPCDRCGSPDLPFSIDGKPSPSPPQDVVDTCAAIAEHNMADYTYAVVTTCQEAVCATPAPTFCGFQISGCPDGNTAKFIVRNNTWNLNKTYRFMGYVAAKEDIPGFWEPQVDDWNDNTPGYLPPPGRNITQELADVNVYNAPNNGLHDLDVYGVSPTYDTDDSPSINAEWYYLYQERWIKGSGTVYDMMYADRAPLFGILFQDEVTQTEMTVCTENDIPVIPINGETPCCGDWWAANFGQSNAARIVGYRGELLFKAPGVAYKSNYHGGSESDDGVMEEQMVCCDTWLFVRLSVGYDSQLNILYAVERDSDGNFVSASETWRETTSYVDAWKACCSTTSGTTSHSTKGTYLALQNLWSPKKRALFYNGRFLKTYDWRDCACDGLHSGCNVWHNRQFHVERCVDCNSCHTMMEATYDIWDSGELSMACVKVCDIYYNDYVRPWEPGYGEPTHVLLRGTKVRQSDIWTSPGPALDTDQVCTGRISIGGFNYHYLTNVVYKSVQYQWEMYGIILETGDLYIREIGTGQVLLLEADIAGERVIYDVSYQDSYYVDERLTEEEAHKRLNPVLYGFRNCVVEGTSPNYTYATNWKDTCNCIETVNNTTTYHLYYVNSEISQWTNIANDPVHHSFSCCGQVGYLKRYDSRLSDSNDRDETVEVYMCGNDITGTIHNPSDHFDVRCCTDNVSASDYAIIATGEWKIQWEIHQTVPIEDSYALLTDGTRCIPATDSNGNIILENGSIKQWVTDDEHHYKLDNPLFPRRTEDTNLQGAVEKYLPFKYTITNTRWAALYHCGGLVIEDRRLSDIQCWKCGDDTFALCPIIDDIDAQKWGFHEQYDYGTDAGYCRQWGELWFGEWIHNPQASRTQPTLTEEDKSNFSEWRNANNVIGVYIVHNGALVSLNPGAEDSGGHDIQEKMPPDETPDGLQRTAPPFTPSGGYWYINDRNAAVRYDKQTNADQAWNHNCYTIPVTLSAQSLDDLPAAPALHCQPKRPQYGIEGIGRGRIVLSGNGVLAVFDSDLGRMDFSASTGCLLGK